MDKKKYILQVAEALFNEFGYNAVGVDLIRDKAKVSKTSIYRYFGSKEKLIETVLACRHLRFETQLNVALSSATDMESRLTAILDWHFQWFRSTHFKGCMFMHAIAEFKGQNEVLVQQALQHKAWLKSLLLSVFEPEQKQIEVKTEAIMSFLEGMIIRAEFGEVAGNEETYRIGARVLAQASI